MPPTILIVPGFWEGPAAFETVSTRLTDDGFAVETAALRSTGTVSPGNPSLKDDVAAVRTCLEKLVHGGQEVLLVLHSAGGFIASEAMEGLSKSACRERGGEGGVVGIVFVTGAVVPEGYEHQSLPFAVVRDGALLCAQPDTLLFHDLAEEDRVKWLARIQPQPARGWNGRTRYVGWKDVPSVYLLCEEDRILPASLQEEMASLAGSKIIRCSAGHMPQLSQPDKVVDVIKAAATA
ncbi:alpha/beta-hydrolase [Aspergillus coremiiformis]|uniref:Alpha/beta-hydrolase n=1 Tax=Aspergillus coremiiformis TaxID=138285 RepID=A0A5N6Z7Y1_9EURO|nr:alpha/beta-hydrolase [Aspergillus coremiiformis]